MLQFGMENNMSKYWFATLQRIYHGGGSPSTYHLITTTHPILELEKDMQMKKKKENRYKEDIASLFYKRIEEDELEELGDIVEQSVKDNCSELYIREEE